MTDIVDSGKRVVDVLLPNEVERSRIAAEQQFQISVAVAQSNFTSSGDYAALSAAVTSAHATRTAATLATQLAVAAARKSAHR